MFDNDTNERGQVGVGTLIVFIAMVLVAAIASGVLINAAGLLQTKSAQASEESSNQVSNRVQVIDAVGTNIDGTNETVGAVNLTTRLSPSANEIDLRNVTVQWTGPSGTFALTHNSTTDGDGDFTVSEIKDADDSSPVLNSRDDRLRMNIDVTGFTSALSAGDSVELRITTDSGATTVVQLQVPQSVAGETAVRL